jgi:peptidyl-prolyl cis-trans isomerase SurA
MNLRQFSAILAGAIFLAGCHKAPPANVAAMVNDRPVTYDEVDRIYKSQLATPGERSSEDLMQIQRLEVLRTLIENEIMRQRAEKLNLLATDSEVEAKFNELKAPYTQEEFQKQLDARKMTVAQVKEQLMRDLTVQKLINKEVTAKIAIADKEISDYYIANRAAFNRAEPTVHLAQILVTAVPEPVRNLKNDKAQNDQQAKQKVAAILAQLRQGADFSMLAENYSEDANSAPNGGDLGYLPLSAFGGSSNSDQLRKMVWSMQPGQVSDVLVGDRSYRILRVISKEPAGQRELNDPRVQQTIRSGLLSRKDQLLRNAYYEVARNEAKVVNYLAMSVVESSGKSK